MGDLVEKAISVVLDNIQCPEGIDSVWGVDDGGGDITVWILVDEGTDDIDACVRWAQRAIPALRKNLYSLGLRFDYHVQSKKSFVPRRGEKIWPREINP